MEDRAEWKKNTGKRIIRREDSSVERQRNGTATQ